MVKCCVHLPTYKLDCIAASTNKGTTPPYKLVTPTLEEQSRTPREATW